LANLKNPSVELMEYLRGQFAAGITTTVGRNGARMIILGVTRVYSLDG